MIVPNELLNRINNLPQTDNKNKPHILEGRLKHPRAYMDWTSEEDAILKELKALNIALAQIVALLKRSESALSNRLDLLPEVNTKPLDVFHQLLAYWRNSLADIDKLGLDTKDLKKGQQYSSDLFIKGQLPPEKVAVFFKDAEASLNYEKKNNIVIRHLPVVIVPFTALLKSEHGKAIFMNNRPTNVYPLWFTATLSREGSLSAPDDQAFPWVDRRCLTPNDSIKHATGFPIISDISDVDSFYTKNNAQLANPGTWQAYTTLAQDLLSTISNNDLPDILSKQNYSLENIGYILPIKLMTESSRALIEVYDQYQKVDTEDAPSLLKQFCSLEEKIFEQEKSIETIYLASQYHLGQMQNKHPLSNSQRISFSYFSDAENNDLFTLHGPPGTGKTNFLLSVIASKWVEAALANRPPPITVASSANNLAVLNILDQLNQAHESHQRWLPDCQTYGLYLAAKKSEPAAIEKNYLYRLQEKDSGSIQRFYTVDYNEKATQTYLEHFNHFFTSQESDVKNCSAIIREKMLKKHSLLTKTIAFSVNYANFVNYFEEKYNDINAVESRINQRILEISKVLSDIKQIKLAWLDFSTGSLKWFRLFSWIKLIKSMMEDKIESFSLKHEHIFEKPIRQLDDIQLGISTKYSSLENERSALIRKQVEITADKLQYSALDEEKAFLEKSLGFSLNTHTIFDYTSPENILAKLDTTLRYDLFILATHYWEACWLIESKMIGTLPYSRAGREKYWQIQAMLTPCLVTTLHKGPAFFKNRLSTGDFLTLSNFIDLLIIDEAGQVMPVLSAPMISIAKKALFTGDAKQLEPIFKLPESIDIANAKKFGLCHSNAGYEQLKKKGILCSGDSSRMHAYSNNILRGQCISKFHLSTEPVPGLILLEHRRCAKEIISYCNELCYDNKLLPMTDEKPSIFPRLGYAHISGETHQAGGSKYNTIEAEVIAEWISRHAQDILNMCEETELSKCISIITPFSSQSKAIKKALNTYHLNVPAGTVHSLQGAEKSIVIFSSTYTEGGEMFFDRSQSMLNVAVSRAKQSFLIFGNMDIFKLETSHRPSSLLAKYVFSEKNQITDITQPKYEKVRKSAEEKIEQISTLDAHRQHLVTSFSKAKEYLRIVSPYLTHKAIYSDNVFQLINQHKERIKIQIFTNERLNTSTNDKAEKFPMIVSQLKDAGAMVIFGNMHSKIIAIDDEVIIEGSFNWLSSVRNDSPYRMMECSIAYSGMHTAKFIREAINPLLNGAQIAELIS